MEISKQKKGKRKSSVVEVILIVSFIALVT